MRVALFDADTLVYKAARAVETPVDWGGGLWTLHAHLSKGVAALHDLVDRLSDRVDAGEIAMALSDYSGDWRKDIYPDYKAHREDKRRPVIWNPLRKYIHNTWRTYQKPGLEGDDVLGILATSDMIRGEEVVISIDKDLKTVPGLHFNPDKEGDVYSVSEEEADYNHMVQALSGDPTDGYPGCPGYGPVRSRRLLNEGLVLEPYEHTFSRGKRKGETETRWEGTEPGSLWEIVVSAYESKGLTEAVALQMAQVSRICRVDDYDLEKEEVIPWTPVI